MNYKNAAEILPQSLLAELQKYVQGEALYVPIPPASHRKWGECSGSKAQTAERNQDIRERFLSGAKMDDLAAEYFLSLESIRRIVYRKSS